MDENKDGLLNREDTFYQEYSVMIYKALTKYNYMALPSNFGSQSMSSSKVTVVNPGVSELFEDVWIAR